MRKILALLLALPALTCALRAELRLELKNGDVIVADKARPSDGAVIVMQGKTMRRIPYADLSEASIAALGAERQAARAAEPKPVPQAAPAPEVQTGPGTSGETGADAAQKPTRLEVQKALAKQSGLMIRKALADLDAKLVECDAKILQKYINEEQRKMAAERTYQRKERLVAFLRGLQLGMVEGDLRSHIQSSLGSVSVGTQTGPNGERGLNFDYSLFGDEQSVFELLLVGPENRLYNWTCSFQIRRR